MMAFLRGVLLLFLQACFGSSTRLTVGARLFLGLLALLLGMLIGVATLPGCQMLNLGELLSPQANVTDSGNVTPAGSQPAR